MRQVRCAVRPILNLKSAIRNDRRVLRRFIADDLLAVKELAHRTVDACYPSVYPPGAVQYFKDYHNDENIGSDANEGIVLVLEASGEIVGTGTLVGTHMQRVYVAPECQRRGYGRTIVQALETEARERGITRLDLDVNPLARSFYTALGYRIVEETSLECDNADILEYCIMEKHL